MNRRRRQDRRQDQAHHHRRAPQHQGPVALPQDRPHPRPGLDRPRRRRPVLGVLRPRGGLQGPGPAHLPRPGPGRGHGLDRLHHLLRLLAHHRVLPVRRRRLHRRHPHPGREGRRHLRQRPARRLHADDHRLHRRLRRRHLQLLPGLLPAVQDPLRDPGHPLPGRHQPPRHQGIGDHAGADLHPLRRDPRPDDRLRHPQAHPRDRGGRRGHQLRLPERPGDHRPRAAWPCSSCGPSPWAAGPSPASRPSRTASRSCASPGSTTARGPWSICPSPWP